MGSCTRVVSSTSPISYPDPQGADHVHIKCRSEIVYNFIRKLILCHLSLAALVFALTAIAVTTSF